MLEGGCVLLDVGNGEYAPLPRTKYLSPLSYVLQIYQCLTFTWTICQYLGLLGNYALSSLKMEATNSSEMLINIYQYKRRNTPDGFNLLQHYPTNVTCCLILSASVDNGGTRWRSWLRHCIASQKVAVSIPDVVTGIFHWRNPSGRTMALGSTQPLT
jgi:hypothetical protein